MSFYLREVTRKSPTCIYISQKLWYLATPVSEKGFAHGGLQRYFIIIFRPKRLEFHTYSILNKKATACPREVVARCGYPLGLVEFMIERVYQVFLSFEPFEFGIFWNLHQPKGAHPSLSSTYRILGIAHLIIFMK